MKVDLSNFFKDERRQSLVFIDATWQNIKDVQDHIQNLFSLVCPQGICVILIKIKLSPAEGH